MAVANWNGHTFVVTSELIRSFREMRIKGSCETVDKNADKQKYVERKYGEAPEITLTLDLNAMTGVTDVYSEAMAFVSEATAGACDYFYLGGSKVFPAKLMLIDAQIGEVQMMPGRGDAWIACKVEMTFKQGAKNDGSASGGSGSGSGGSAKTSVKTGGGVVSTAVQTAINTVSKIVETAKANSSSGEGMLAQATENVQKAQAASVASGMVNALTKASTTGVVSAVKTVRDTAAKTSATTQRTSGYGGGGKTTQIVRME